MGLFDWWARKHLEKYPSRLRHVNIDDMILSEETQIIDKEVNEALIYIDNNVNLKEKYKDEFSLIDNALEIKSNAAAEFKSTQTYINNNVNLKEKYKDEFSLIDNALETAKNEVLTKATLRKNMTRLDRLKEIKQIKDKSQRITAFYGYCKRYNINTYNLWLE